MLVCAYSMYVVMIVLYSYLQGQHFTSVVKEEIIITVGGGNCSINRLISTEVIEVMLTYLLYFNVQDFK